MDEAGADGCQGDPCPVPAPRVPWSLPLFASREQAYTRASLPPGSPTALERFGSWDTWAHVETWPSGLRLADVSDTRQDWFSHRGSCWAVTVYSGFRLLTCSLSPCTGDGGQ